MTPGQAMLEALFVAGIGLVGSIATNAYYYGKLTQKVSSIREDVNELRDDVKDHETRISHLEGQKARHA